jgi:predicted DNA-binding protein
MKSLKKNHVIGVRLNDEMYMRFINMSHEFGGTSQVMREMVSAFIDERMTIEPPTLKGTLYVNRKQPS